MTCTARRHAFADGEALCACGHAALVGVDTRRALQLRITHQRRELRRLNRAIVRFRRECVEMVSQVQHYKARAAYAEQRARPGWWAQIWSRWCR